MSTELSTYGLSNVDLKELANIEAEMNTTYERVESAQKTAFVKFGELLCEARELINDDQLFGTWRKDRTPFESKENANKAMQLHRAIQDGRISQKMLHSKMGQSHLLELKDAPISVQKTVEDNLKHGKVLSIKKLREMKKVANNNAQSSSTHQAEEQKKADNKSDYSNGYAKIDEAMDTNNEKVINPKKDEDAEPPKPADPKEEYLNFVNSMILGFDEVLADSAKAHGIAINDIKCQTRTKFINELRRNINKLKSDVEDHFDEVEEMDEEA